MCVCERERESERDTVTQHFPIFSDDEFDPIQIRKSDEGADGEVRLRRQDGVHQVEGRQHRLQRRIVKKEKLSRLSSGK